MYCNFSWIKNAILLSFENLFKILHHKIIHNFGDIKMLDKPKSVLNLSLNGLNIDIMQFY